MLGYVTLATIVHFLRYGKMGEYNLQSKHAVKKVGIILRLLFIVTSYCPFYIGSEYTNTGIWCYPLCTNLCLDQIGVESE